MQEIMARLKDRPPEIPGQNKLQLSSNTSKVSPARSPAQPAKEDTDLQSPTRAKSDAHALDESETKDGITNEESSDMEIEYISLPNLKREIRRADFTGDQVFLCCIPRHALLVDQMHNMQDKSDDDGLDPIRRKLPIGIHKGGVSTIRNEQEFADLPPHRPERDHQIRLDTEDNPAWVHPYKMHPSPPPPILGP